MPVFVCRKPLGNGPPEEMRKFLAIKLLQNLASNLVYSWDNIRPPAEDEGRNSVATCGKRNGKGAVPGMLWKK